jgi:UDP-3-O-[3-hydroxymyristoyl] glucosamine N-acyltransferase
MTGKKSLTLKEAAAIVGGSFLGEETHKIYNIADLASAGQEDVSFLANPRYHQQMLRSRAGVILVAEDLSPLPEGHCYILVKDPSVSFQKLIHFFFDPSKSKSAFSGIHPTALVHPSVVIGKGVTIGPYAVIDREASIGDRTYVAPFVSIGPSTHIGDDCCLHPHVVIREQCCLGNRVILQPGCVIGSCGFGYATDKEGKHTKHDQVGIVTIEDDVEIGANTTIDRSRFKSTLVKKGTKIDNLVQLGHGVVIGEHNLLVAQAGVAGSSETESQVVIGGQVGIAGHLKVGKGAMIAAQAGVSKNLKGGEGYGGYPAEPFKEYQRRAVHLRRIESYVQRIEQLEKELKEIKEALRSRSNP